jgi:ADP-heptose:LPS heptosyltransferase
MLFVSLDQKEYTSFQSKYNIDIPHYHCRTIMDLIMKINSCKLFIGNFSAPFTIAIALHKICIGISPTNKRHTIDLQLMKNMNTYWKHVTIL